MFGRRVEWTELERTELKYVFGPAFDPSRIEIRVGGWGSWGASRTIGRRLFFDARVDFLTVRGRSWTLGLVVHECVHVWQYEQRGWRYAADSLTAQLHATIRNGSRNGAYVYELDPPSAGPARPFAHYGAEQQAQMIEDWYLRDRHATDRSSRRHCTNWEELSPGEADRVVGAYLELIRSTIASGG